MTDGELVDVSAVGFGEERGETQALFEADDAVLGSDRGTAGHTGDHEEDECHDDVPEIRVLPAGPSVDGDVDGEDEVKREKGNDGEVEEWVIAGVGFECLRGRHGTSSFARNDGGVSIALPLC